MHICKYTALLDSGSWQHHSSTTALHIGMHGCGILSKYARSRCSLRAWRIVGGLRAHFSRVRNMYAHAHTCLHCHIPIHTYTHTPQRARRASRADRDMYRAARRTEGMRQLAESFSISASELGALLQPGIFMQVRVCASIICTPLYVSLCMSTSKHQCACAHKRCRYKDFEFLS
jgi:hypothetical protein